MVQWGNGAKKETSAAVDKTVMLDESSAPLIFGWLIDLQTEKTWRIDRDAFHIGSGKTADLSLPSKGLKELHCSFYYVQDHFELNDNNTSLGTRVNNRRIKRTDLADDDVIGIGEFDFQFKCFKGQKNG